MSARHAVVLLLFTSCALDLDLPPAPGEVPLTVTLDAVSPAVTRAGEDVEITFTGSEALVSCSAEVAGRAATCGAPDEAACRCTFRPFVELGEGELQVTVRVRTEARNAEARGSVRLDLTPPTITADRLALVRRPLGEDDRFHAEADAAADAGLAYEGQGVSRLRVWADALAPAPLLELDVTAGGEVDAALPGTGESSPASLWVSAVDLPGNESARVAVTAGADAEPPVVIATSLTGGFRRGGEDDVVGGPGAATDAVGAVRIVRVFAESTAGEPIASVAPMPDGSFTAPLGDTVLTDVWVAAEDKSGNVSVPVKAARRNLTLDLVGRKTHDDASAPAALYAFTAPAPLEAAPGLGVLLGGEAGDEATARAAVADGAREVTQAAIGGGDVALREVRLSPGPRERAAYFELPGTGLVLERGDVGGTGAWDAWRLDGTAWRPLPDVGFPLTGGGPPVLQIEERKTFRIGDRVHAYDRGNNFGNLWIRGAERWEQFVFVSGTSPAELPLFTYQYAFDATRSRTIYVGHYYDNSGGVIFQDENWVNNTVLNRITLTWQSSWTRVDPPFGGSPAARDGFSLAYHPAFAGVVLVGGRDRLGADDSGSTWLYTAAGWSVLFPSGPPPRRHASLALDPARNVLVLFGGRAFDGTPLGDTWELSATGWREVDVAGPSPRFDAHLQYDTASARLILHGGSYPVAEAPNTETAARGDTWAYDGAAWTLLDELPEVKCGQAVAHDPRRGRTVLFGGSRGRCESSASYKPFLSAETWEHDGERWLPRALDPSPPARFGAAMAYDAWRGVLVLFGGDAAFEGACVGGDRDCDDTWEYDGLAWKKVDVTGPPARVGAAMTFDSTRGLILLQGGRDRESGERRGDLWAYDGASWRPLEPIGPAGVRSHHLLAYDAKRDRTLSWGSNARGLFEWDGAAFTPGEETGAPLYRECPDDQGCWAGAFDPVVGRVVALARDASFADVYSIDGAGFQKRADTNVDARGYGATWDGTRGRLFVHGARGRFEGLTWSVAGETPRADTAAHLVRFTIDPGVRLVSLVPRYTGVASSTAGEAPPLLYVWSWASSAWVPAGSGDAPVSPAAPAAELVRDGTIWLLVTAPGPANRLPSVIETDHVALDVVTEE